MDGTEGRFVIDAWDWGLGIVEELAPRTSLTIWGEGKGQVTESKMMIPLSGTFEYHDYTGSSVSGPVVKCESQNHLFTLVKQ
jgi:hypothetical protein